MRNLSEVTHRTVSEVAKMLHETHGFQLHEIEGMNLGELWGIASSYGSVDLYTRPCRMRTSDSDEPQIRARIEMDGPSKYDAVVGDYCGSAEAAMVDVLRRVMKDEA
jgi:hypothetical protein